MCQRYGLFDIEMKIDLGILSLWFWFILISIFLEYSCIVSTISKSRCVTKLRILISLVKNLALKTINRIYRLFKTIYLKQSNTFCIFIVKKLIFISDCSFLWCIFKYIIYLRSYLRKSFLSDWDENLQVQLCNIDAFVIAELLT